MEAHSESRWESNNTSCRPTAETRRCPKKHFVEILGAGWSRRLERYRLNVNALTWSTRNDIRSRFPNGSICAKCVARCLKTFA